MEPGQDPEKTASWTGDGTLTGRGGVGTVGERCWYHADGRGWQWAGIAENSCHREKQESSGPELPLPHPLLKSITRLRTVPRGWCPPGARQSFTGQAITLESSVRRGGERESEGASRTSELKGTQAVEMPTHWTTSCSCSVSQGRHQTPSNRTGGRGLSRIWALAPQQGAVQREGTVKISCISCNLCVAQTQVDHHQNTFFIFVLPSF